MLDLRGNGGGTSDWAQQIADLLWGRGKVAALPEPEVHVDWRASPANLVEIAKAYGERRGTEGFSPEADKWFRSVIGGLGSAIARGNSLWRHVDLSDDTASDAPPTAPAVVDQAPSPPLAGPVYVLTDASCASACLDAVDLWTALGAIQIGRTTSADTQYMEIRERTLPSGLVGIAVPMKVYRGRKRGNNEPAIPVHMFNGDIGDTAAVEVWVSTLPNRR